MGRFSATVVQSGNRLSSISICILAIVALLAPFQIQAQTSPGATSDPSDAALLEGSVRDSSGRALAGATVSLQPKDGAPTVSANTDARGSYHFSGLREGIYILRAQLAGYRAADSDPCVVEANKAKRVDLTLEPVRESQAAPPGKAGASPEFFDEPQFTVAGVTDGTNLGGHGSNTIVRTKESLAKDIASLSVSQEKPSVADAAPASRVLNSPTENSLRAAADGRPKDFAANHQAGRLLLDDGKAADALPYLERASQLNPGDRENSFMLASAYAGAGQYQKARASAHALLAVQSPAGQAFPAHDQASLHHLLADIAEKIGDPLEAVREYQKAAELDPNEANFFDWGAELLLHRAVEPAIDVFGQGNRLFPWSARMLLALGVASYSNGSYDQAAERLCQASDLNPSDPKPYLFLGKIQSVETTQSDCSLERLRRFVTLQPENAMAHYYYAVSLWKRRSGPDDAAARAQVESQLKRAVQLDTGLGLGYLQLGILYAEQKDYSRAISSYQNAIKASPQLEEAHYRLSQAYKRTGEASKAQQELRLYEEITRKKDEEVERERGESRQFVYTLRTPAAPSR